MKAIQISRNGGPEVLEYIERDDPVPAADEVLVRAAAIGVAKPDYLMRSGKYRWAPPLPSIIGNEMAGHVAAVGSAIADIAVGDPVLVWGYEQGCYATASRSCPPASLPKPPSASPTTWLPGRCCTRPRRGRRARSMSTVPPAASARR